MLKTKKKKKKIPHKQNSKEICRNVTKKKIKRFQVIIQRSSIQKKKKKGKSLQ